MESNDYADQGSDGGLGVNKSAVDSLSDDPSLTEQGGEEDSKKGNKRKAPSSDTEEGIVPKKVQLKAEEHVKGEVPAHHARRPPNGFLLFCKRHRDIVSAKNPNLENRGVTKLLGNWWRTLEEDERDKYKELARQNKEIFIANNPQFTWYKLPAPPLRTLVTRPSNRRPPKLEPSLISSAGPITPGKLADESQLGGLTSLLSLSLSPPTTPLNTSPPLPAAITAPAPPKKRFLLQTRAKQRGDDVESLSESDEAIDENIKKIPKKKYKKKKHYSSLKYKKNLKIKWSQSLSEKTFKDEGNEPASWKSENGCTQQQLIEKIVDSTFENQKSFQDFDVQRTLDYINTEHTYQKNPNRFWQQHKQKHDRRDDSMSLQQMGKGERAEGNIISPNVNNNTIVLPDVRHEGINGLSYSFNDNNNLIIDYDPNQRKLDQSNVQTNHDRTRTSKKGDGYIPGGKKSCVEITQADCDISKRLEDQKKPFKVAQSKTKNGERALVNEIENYDTEDDEEDEDDEGDVENGENDDEDNEEDEDADCDENDGIEIPKNCDRVNANFQSILGKVSREIVSMIKERGPEDVEELAVARFNMRPRSETDSDGSSYDKSDYSPPESPGGRRSKRSCKGQRYEQFIKDSVSKKRSKNSHLYLGIEDGSKRKMENKITRRKRAEESETGREDGEIFEKVSRFLTKDKEFSNKVKDQPQANNISEDLTMKEGTKASDIIQLKLDLESKFKRETNGKNGRKNRDVKAVAKKKPISKVQMIKEKKELHMGEFNLNEKIEELPLLSFESFLMKKRQRKKRLLGLKKDGIKSKVMKNRMEKLRARSPNVSDCHPAVPNKLLLTSAQSINKPDFADLTTLAETALTLLSLREPR